MSERGVALVTGASRGIGKATALKLAEAGFDVAIAARTQKEGEGRTAPSSVRGDEPTLQIPGSLESTAHEIEARGRRALPVRLDLLDVDTVVSAPQLVLDEWGRIDVLVNNAIVQGASMDRILDLTAESMTRLVVGNYVHQVLITQQVLPHMLSRGSGRIVNIVSGSARLDPRAPAGEGGWGIAYSASKAAFAARRRRHQRRVRAHGRCVQRRSGQRDHREAQSDQPPGRVRGQLRLRASGGNRCGGGVARHRPRPRSRCSASGSSRRSSPRIAHCSRRRNPGPRPGRNVRSPPG